MSCLTDRQRAVVATLVEAYRAGAFPMADPDSGEVNFYTAHRRGVLPVEPGAGFRVPRSVLKAARGDRFELRADTAFRDVVRGCAAPRRDEPKTWISRRIIDWYTLLHSAGRAHSVEAWRRDPATGESRLVGGIYGVAIGGAFFGESMFHRARPRLRDGSRHPLDGTDASKVCLLALVRHLQRRGYRLFDTQLVNDHIARFGVVEVSHREYMDRLAAAIDLPVDWGEFDAACVLDAPAGP